MSKNNFVDRINSIATTPLTVQMQNAAINSGDMLIYRQRLIEWHAAAELVT